jgi:hypothetical protein
LSSWYILRDFSPQANYTDRATAAYRRTLWYNFFKIQLPLNYYTRTIIVFIHSAYTRSGLNCINLHYRYYEDFVISWGGVRLGPPVLYQARMMDARGAYGEMSIVMGKPKQSGTSATLFTKNPTWSDLGLNPGRRGGKPATNHLNNGKAFIMT